MGSSTDTVAGGLTAPRRIGILGFAETVHDAPFKDPSWEMWGMNGLWRVLKDIPEQRFSAWFELHTPEYILEHERLSNIGTAQSDWLKKEHPFPVFMQKHYPEYPSSVEFDITGLIGQTGMDYFTSSVAFETAMALVLPNVEELGFWGIDLIHGTEWGDQRPCAEYWIGRAAERGIKITTHPKSALLKARYRYAYEEQPLVVTEMRNFIIDQAKCTKAKLDELEEQNGKIVAERQVNDGVMQFLRVLNERLDMFGRGGVI